MGADKLVFDHSIETDPRLVLFLGYTCHNYITQKEASYILKVLTICFTHIQRKLIVNLRGRM